MDDQTCRSETILLYTGESDLVGLVKYFISPSSMSEGAY
jgi:hypothetical protein